MPFFCDLGFPFWIGEPAEAPLGLVNDGIHVRLKSGRMLTFREPTSTAKYKPRRRKRFLDFSPYTPVVPYRPWERKRVLDI